MKAITLYQPWAMLVALGKKQIETRSWKTDYRGPLAIHVAKKFTKEQHGLCGWFTEPFAGALQGELWDKKTVDKKYKSKNDIPSASVTVYRHIEDNLHLGCVIAVCYLVAVVEIPQKNAMRIVATSKARGMSYFAPELIQIPPLEPELSFGDYTPGRYAWILRDVQMLEKPVPVKGKQRLWDWNEGEKIQ
jgi:hypothetical protein